MVSIDLPTPTKAPLLINALLVLAILLSFVSWGIVMAYNSLFSWLGLMVVSPYAAYLCHKRLHPETRPDFWVA